MTHCIWDGMTDSGSMALNGRYVVYVKVKDAEGAETRLEPLVLVK